jgi:hypothetical protein
VEQEETAIARQRLCKRVFAARNRQATIEEMFEAVFSVLSGPRLHSEDQRETLNHVNPNFRGIGQGEARHKKYKRLKLDGGQAYDRSSE